MFLLVLLCFQNPKLKKKSEFIILPLSLEWFPKKKNCAFLLNEPFCVDGYAEYVDQEWSSALKNPNPMCLMQGCVAVVFWEGSG